MIKNSVTRVYFAIRRTLHSAATVVRWRTTQHSSFDHDQLIHDSRWQKFLRERVLPASEQAVNAGIPLENFPIVRQSQMGTIVAYSLEYIRDMFNRNVEESSVCAPKERYVLLLRGPKTESETELEPKFKDVVTDMLQFKQVTLSINVFLIDCFAIEDLGSVKVLARAACGENCFYFSDKRFTKFAFYFIVFVGTVRLARFFRTNLARNEALTQFEGR